jgi:hypothetical protein
MAEFIRNIHTSKVCMLHPFYKINLVWTMLTPIMYEHIMTLKSIWGSLIPMRAMESATQCSEMDGQSMYST